MIKVEKHGNKYNPIIQNTAVKWTRWAVVYLFVSGKLGIVRQSNADAERQNACIIFIWAHLQASDKVILQKSYESHQHIKERFSNTRELAKLNESDHSFQ